MVNYETEIVFPFIYIHPSILHDVLGGLYDLVASTHQCTIHWVLLHTGPRVVNVCKTINKKAFIPWQQLQLLGAFDNGFI